MPTDFRISDLPTSIPFNNLDLMEVSQVDSESPSGYSSVKKTMEELGEKLNNDIQYASALATTNKKIIPAINELLAAIADVADEIPANSDFSLSGLSDTTITTPSSGQVLSYNNEGKVVNENLANIYSNTTVGSISLYKFGPIICCVIGASWETDSNGRLIIDGVYTLIPTAYRPSDAINGWDTNNDTRMYINTAGVITIPAKVSQTNLAIRASFTWFRVT